MPFALLFIAVAAVFLGSAVVIVGLATALVFNFLGVFWGTTSLFVVTCIYCGSIAWVWRDARQRGKPGWAAAVLVALGLWPCGLLLWILFRPEKIAAAPKANFPSPTLPPVIN